MSHFDFSLPLRWRPLSARDVPMALTQPNGMPSQTQVHLQQCLAINQNLADTERSRPAIGNFYLTPYTTLR